MRGSAAGPPEALTAASLRHHRAWSLAALAVLVLLAWYWLATGAGTGMAPGFSLRPPPIGGGMAGMGSPGAASGWAAARFGITAAMWLAMMVAMMLPSAAPMILLHARAVPRGQPAVRPPTAEFLAGYLLAWASFSLAAAALQLLLEGAGLVDRMAMATDRSWLAAGLLLIAGLYQLSPVKDVCLRHCRNPAQFLSRHYRHGRIGALRMGLVHGSYCVGCCGLLMGLLFVGGVMNLAWVALLTCAVAAEKMLPHGRRIAIATGLGAIGWGLAILLA